MNEYDRVKKGIWEGILRKLIEAGCINTKLRSEAAQPIPPILFLDYPDGTGEVIISEVDNKKG